MGDVGKSSRTWMNTQIVAAWTMQWWPRFGSPILTTYYSGRGASTSFSNPKTADVEADDTIGFSLGGITYLVNPSDTMSSDDSFALTLHKNSYPFQILHLGPASAWLSRSATSNLTEYEGDGDWFKIQNVIGRTEQSSDRHSNINDKWDQRGVYFTVA
jgi:hypothetical protein